MQACLDEQTHSGNEGNQRQEPLNKQPAQSSSKGKQPVQSDTEGKQRQDPLSRQPAESKSKGKQPVLRSSEETVEAGSRSQGPQQLPLNKSKQAGTRVLQNRPKQQMHSIAEEEESQDPPPKQPAESKSKGKQPVRPAQEQPLQSSPRSENPRKIPLEKPTRAKPKATQPRPHKPQVESDSEDQQRQGPQAETAAPKKSKDIPLAVLSRTFPKCFIVRIPVERGSAMERVKVRLCPDTTFRHPQTFFFKVIPQLEPYWGERNMKAFSATRIVRLEHEGKPTPYFLMVCRGELCKARSPRNKNSVFGAMDEPIFGDAFVFKLSDPEINENGYTIYENIEDDFGSSRYLPGAIRRAASRVHDATPRHANPGFPDMTNYADPEKMREDSERLAQWNRKVWRAERKYTSEIPLDEASGRPDLERIEAAVASWTNRLFDMQKGGLLPSNEGSKLGNYQPIYDLKREVTALQNAIRDIATDTPGAESPSASTDIPSLDPETSKFPQKLIDHFMAVRKSFLAMETFAQQIIETRIRELSSETEPTGEFDELASLYMVEAIDATVASWRNGEVPLTASNVKMMDELLAKGRTIKPMMEQRKSRIEIHKVIIEMNKLRRSLEEQAVNAQAILAEVEAGLNALTGPAPEADGDEDSGPRSQVLKSGSTYRVVTRLN